MLLVQGTETRDCIATIASGKNNPSSTATTNVTSNAHQTLFMNNNHGANTIPGTMSESQYTSQLQFSAPHDKQNDSNSATTSTTMNSTTCPNFGYMTIAPPQVIMNNGGPIDVMGPMNPMNPMNSAHYMNNVSPMNTNNGIQGVSDTTPMNPMNPLKFNQGIYANTVPDGNMAPPWAAQFFQGLDLRLNQLNYKYQTRMQDGSTLKTQSKSYPTKSKYTDCEYRKSNVRDELIKNKCLSCGN